MNPLDPALFSWRVRATTAQGSSFQIFYRTREEADVARRLLLEPGSVPREEIPPGFQVGKPTNEDVVSAVVERRFPMN